MLITSQPTTSVTTIMSNAIYAQTDDSSSTNISMAVRVYDSWPAAYSDTSRKSTLTMKVHRI